MCQRKSRLIIFTILLFTISANGQSPFLDSLYQSYLVEPVETKYYTLYRYCFRLSQYNMERTALMLEKGERGIENSNLSESEIAYHLGLFSKVRASLAENRGEADSSLLYYQQVFEFAKKTTGKKQYRLEADANWGMATYFGQQGFYDKSTQQFLKAEDAYLKADNPAGRANCFAMVAQNYQLAAKFDSTLLFCNKALALIDPKLNKNNYYNYVWFKVNAFNELVFPDSTIKLVSTALLEEAKNENPVIYAHLSFGLADAYSIKEMIPQAKKHLEAGKKILSSSEDSQLNYDYLLSNDQFLVAAKDFKAAYEAKTILEAHKDTLDKRVNEAKFMDLQSKYDTKNKEYEIATLKNKNEYQSNLLKLGGGMFAVIIGSLFFWFKFREEKIRAIQAKNNQQIKIATKYEDSASEIEDEFLKNVTNFIQENLANEDLTVENLVKHCGMNRNVMNKKIKSLVNKTAVGLIRDMRLEKAYLLLQKNNKNVSQVAFEVGFKDPSYFSACFREKFGVTPSSLVKIG